MEPITGQPDFTLTYPDGTVRHVTRAKAVLLLAGRYVGRSPVPEDTTVPLEENAVKAAKKVLDAVGTFAEVAEEVYFGRKELGGIRITRYTPAAP